MNDVKVYMYVVGVLVSISGVLSWWIIRRLSKAGDDTLERFRGVDKILNDFDKRIDINKQAVGFKEKEVDGRIDRIEERLYKLSEIITVLKIRSEKDGNKG
jgi:hypothetical protein